MMWLLSENEALIFLEVSMRNFHAHTHFLMHTNAHQLFHSLAQLAKFLLSTIWSMLRSIPTVGECEEVMEIETMHSLIQDKTGGYLGAHLFLNRHLLWSLEAAISATLRISVAKAFGYRPCMSPLDRDNFALHTQLQALGNPLSIHYV
jgi:hypothetical protein